MKRATRIKYIVCLIVLPNCIAQNEPHAGQGSILQSLRTPDKLPYNMAVSLAA